MAGKVALITGAGSGIGRAVALALAKTGFTVVLAGRRLAQLETVATEINSDTGATAVAITADVTDPTSVDALFARTAKKLGRLDLLFIAPLEDVTLADWRSVVDTNLTGAFLCTQAAFRLMKAQQPRGGRIINNGSISATVPRPRMVAYTATKHAMTGLTKSTSLEGREYDIACGQIDIGNTATALASPMAHGTLQADLSLKPEPMFDVKHAADAVVYMAGLPLEANVLFMTVMATKMPFVGRG
jgi:NAD(P)-dependent dehydrogenase (short-subunit alcohol dehydrogenase family)